MRFALLALMLLPRTAGADPEPEANRAPERKTERDPDATITEIFRGPFHSSRLFAMPTADVIGAYMFSVSLDGSLLQQPGVLTSAGVIAAGFGDIAQLEYRHTEAISVTDVNAPGACGRACSSRFRFPSTRTCRSSASRSGSACLATSSSAPRRSKKRSPTSTSSRASG